MQEPVNVARSWVARFGELDHLQARDRPLAVPANLADRQIHVGIDGPLTGSSDQSWWSPHQSRWPSRTAWAYASSDGTRSLIAAYIGFALSSERYRA